LEKQPAFATCSVSYLYCCKFPAIVGKAPGCQDCVLRLQKLAAFYVEKRCVLRHLAQNYRAPLKTGGVFKGAPGLAAAFRCCSVGFAASFALHLPALRGTGRCKQDFAAYTRSSAAFRCCSIKRSGAKRKVSAAF
jgi:hypothetical protein